MRFPSIVVFLAYAANNVVANIFEEDGTVDLTPLGTYDLSELDYSLDFALDENSCEYSLEVGFSHQSEFFVGSADTCRPGVNDPYDGRSVLEGRWRFQSFPSYIEASTGLDHVSIDYNPCGRKYNLSFIASLQKSNSLSHTHTHHHYYLFDPMVQRSWTWFFGSTL